MGVGTRERYDGPLTREAVADARSRLGPGEVLAGWLPFDPSGDGALVRPERFAPGGLDRGPSPRRAIASRPLAPRELMSRDEYRSAVDGALDRIVAREVEKVVLARAVEFSAEGVDPIAAMRGARRRDPRVFAFAYDGAGAGAGTDAGSGGEAGADARASAAAGVGSRAGARGSVSGAAAGRAPVRRTLFGASPELLVRKRGPLVTSMPLAGSRPRSDDPEVDRAAATSLLASAKDRDEHAFVVRQIAASLAAVCGRVVVPPEPSLVATDSMWHLATSLQGVIADPLLSVVDVAVSLHPTPAICGTPIDAALDVIRRNEPVARGLYGGAVGWCDAAGDGEWAVTLRSGQLIGDRVVLHSGAGIVAGSNPDEEWRETAAKLGTMERALGVAARAPESTPTLAVAG